ncbi:MAG: sigma-54-dependent Fis family transcriptional regulator [Desulfomonile tiedjei]|uniref:Sigma-54-dependent Fis family transcriptional regulator n=1 Tax=Desulfomonile tiedjei TaxID=2358 RepID=A0A9D6UZ98_9BACT|nr:sigma-54-dependent Fis family transcriptional regulator [Desulfomonile tiedjei]
MRVAIVDDEPIVRNRLQSALTKQGYALETFGSGEDFLESQEACQFDLVFLDMRLPGINGIDVLKTVQSRFSQTEVILITGYASIDSVIEAVKLGAFHYVAKPLKLDEIRHLANKALERKRLLDENRELKTQILNDYVWGEMIGNGQRIKEVFGMISKVAPLDCNVFIQGDSGTGKELVARSIHRESRRKDRPFVAFNCAGFAEDLIASELFGYQRGAFTGASATKMGILETAHEGTVFMDEIGDMPLSMQGKLLRVIQERQIIRVGANKPIQLDLRFIAATNKDLKRAISEGRFREDLYFRLNVVQITLPNLMERKEDIPILIRHFITKYSRKFSKRICGIDSAAQKTLLAYTYPGNVRELENIIERAVALAETETLTVKDLPADLRDYSVTTYGKWLTWQEREHEYLRKVLEYTGHDLGETSRILKLPRTTLWRKMKKYGLSRSHNKNCLT